MGTHHVLFQVTKALQRALWEAFESDPSIGRTMVPGVDHISLSNPTETAQQTDKRLSLWLYRVEENEYLKNQAPTWREGPGESYRVRKTPLCLDLWYLVTPASRSPDSDLLLLGRSLQMFHDRSTMRISDGGVTQEVRVVLGRISLEELTRIWEALNEPYRLSVCYLARVTQIDSAQQDDAAPIVSSTRGYSVLDPAAAAEGGVNAGRR